MSPPEAKPYDSFSSPPKPHHTSLPPTTPAPYDPANTLPPMKSCRTPESKTMKVLLSPPVSPWTGNQHKVINGVAKVPVTQTNAGILKDRVLYPTAEIVDEISKPEPLFPSTPERLAAEEIVTKHIACHLQQFDRKINRPTRDEYLLALSCVATIGKSYNQNPGLYLKRQRQEVDEYYSQAKRICARPGYTSAVVKIAPAPAKTPPKGRRGSRATAKSPKVKVTSPPKFTRVKKAPKNLNSEPSEDVPGNSAEPKKKQDDVDYSSLPDFCPPTSDLPNAKCLKTEWPSGPLDISLDPDRLLLHEAEVHLASTLRLTCATYLCSKRRIFEARLAAFKKKKEFRKTDAQQACRIDVNKASKLWQVYDRVGWFNKSHLEKFL